MNILNNILNKELIIEEVQINYYDVNLVIKKEYIQNINYFINILNKKKKIFIKKAYIRGIECIKDITLNLTNEIIAISIYNQNWYNIYISYILNDIDKEKAIQYNYKKEYDREEHILKKIVYYFNDAKTIYKNEKLIEQLKAKYNN